MTSPFPIQLLRTALAVFLAGSLNACKGCDGAASTFDASASTPALGASIKSTPAFDASAVRAQRKKLVGSASSPTGD